MLRRCLRSLRKNASLPYRVIIINDGKYPLSFKDERIHVVNNKERKGLGAARKQFAELVETEFLFALDNDVMVLPRSLESQLQALDRNSQLAAVSGLHFRGRRFCEVADFEMIGNQLIKRKYDPIEIFASKSDLFVADFIPISHTMFRMKAVADITFDPSYKIGYDHWDTFMQFYYTNWKCAVHKKSRFLHLHRKSPKKYLIERYKDAMLEVSRRHFIKKWGYYPVLPEEVRAGMLRKRIKRLTTGHIQARAHAHTLAMYIQSRIYEAVM